MSPARETDHVHSLFTAMHQAGDCGAVASILLDAVEALRDASGNRGAIAGSRDLLERLCTVAAQTLHDSGQATARGPASDSSMLGPQALAALRLAAWRWDRRSGHIELDALHQAFLGLPARAWTGTLGALAERVHPDDRPRLRSIIGRARRRRQFDYRAVEMRVRHADNHWRRFVVDGQAVCDASGRIIQVIGITREAGATGPTLDALLDSQARLAAAERIADIGSFELDLRTRRLLGSDNLYRLFRLPVGPESGPDTFLEHVCADDRDALVDTMAELYDRRDLLDTTFRIVRGDGLTRHVRAIGEVTRTRKHRRRLIGTVQDITDKHLRESELDARTREQAAVMELGQHTLRQFSLEPLFEAAVRSIEKVAQPLFTGLYRTDEEGLRCLVGSGAPDVAPPGQQLLRQHLGRLGSLSRGTPLSLPLDDSDSRCCVSVPLVVAGDTLWGMINVVLAQRLPLDWHLRDFLVTIANVVTEGLRRHAAEEEARRAQRALEDTADAVLLTGPGRVIYYCNPAFTRITGYSRDEVCGQKPDMLFLDPAQQPQIRASLQATGQWRGEFAGRRRDGQRFTALLTVSRITNGQNADSVAVFSDISHLKAYEERLHHLAYHDGTTQLPNRSAFGERLSAMLTDSRTDRRQLGLLYIDLDRFKYVNDSFGHAAGDRVLIELTARMRSALREQDFLARLGGDEFAAILPQADRGNCVEAARRLNQALRQPVQVNEESIYVSASIGIAAAPDDGREAEALLAHADSAMYLAKQGGRNTFAFCPTDSDQRAARVMSTAAALHRAIEHDEFEIHYQPGVDLRTGRIIRAEALLRWRREGRLIPPDEFIPVAEELGVLEPLGDWLLDHACRQTHGWRRVNPDLRLAVNVSSRQFLRGDLAQRIDAALTRARVPAGCLDIEITESSLMQDPDVATASLERLAGLGVRIALDDFGTGYSSLSYLSQFPLHYLKIDRSFVAGMLRNQTDQAIVKAVIGLADSLGMGFVAEGVERPEQHHYLMRAGCREGQGFLYSRPLPADELKPLIEAGRLEPVINPA